MMNESNLAIVASNSAGGHLMADDFAIDVFLSHSSRDNKIVRPLAERLRKDGLQVWFDEWELRPGDSIPSKIEAGLEHSSVLVLCMLAQAFGSDWSQLESDTFRFRDPLNQDRRFIPPRHDETAIIRRSDGTISSSSRLGVLAMEVRIANA